MSKDLFSSRTPFEKCYLVENVKHLSFIPGNRTLRTAHINRIFKAFLDGEWMPPIYVSADGEVLDGQNRLAAFRMLKEKYPQNKTAIRVITCIQCSVAIISGFYLLIGTLIEFTLCLLPLEGVINKGRLASLYERRSVMVTISASP